MIEFIFNAGIATICILVSLAAVSLVFRSWDYPDDRRSDTSAPRLSKVVKEKVKRRW